MIQETDEDRAERERLFERLERAFWHDKGKRIFGAVRDSDTRPKDGDAKLGSTRE